MNKDFRVRNFILMIFGFLAYLIIFKIDNIVTTISVMFLISNVALILDEFIETKLFHKDSELIKIIKQIKVSKNRPEKLANILSLLYPSIFVTVGAFIMHVIYLLIKR